MNNEIVISIKCDSPEAKYMISRLIAVNLEGFVKSVEIADEIETFVRPDYNSAAESELIIESY